MVLTTQAKAKTAPFPASMRTWFGWRERTLEVGGGGLRALDRAGQPTHSAAPRGQGAHQRHYPATRL